MTQAWLRRHFPAFWPKEIWPPNSPELDPLDYGVWANVQKVSCGRSNPNVEFLKNSIKEAWAGMPEAQVKRTCASFTKRIETCIEKNGSVID